MSDDLWAAVIAACVGVVSAVAAFIASHRALKSQKEAQKESLRAQEKIEMARVAEARNAIEMQFERRLRELREEQQHELRRVLHESRSEHERGLLTLRLNAYQSLMGLLKPLSLDGREAPTPEEARQLAFRLTDWYADEGGLLLSTESRDRLLALRAALLGQPRDDEHLKNEFPPRRDAARLRTQLTKDVLSRGLPFAGLDPE